jgi:hypothetical protein
MCIDDLLFLVRRDGLLLRSVLGDESGRAGPQVDLGISQFVVLVRVLFLLVALFAIICAPLMK